MTEELAQDRVCLRQVEMLESALQCIMLQERISASNHPRAEAKLLQMGGSGAVRETIGKQVAPSKVVQREARAAFIQHIKPMMVGLKLDFCSGLPDRQWQSCIMEPGADACAAGGPCRQARDVLEWPANLWCVDPARVWPGMDWCRGFFEWLIELGMIEEMPAHLQQRRWAACMHA